MESKNIFISAFAAHPNKGSEFAVGWNIPYQIALNSNHNVYLFIGTFEGNGFGKFDGLDKIKLPHNLKIIKVYPDFWVSFFNYFNHRFKIGFVFYFALRRWYFLVKKEAVKLSDNSPPDITHHLGPIGFREPGYLSELNKRHFWGPVGGLARINLDGIKNKNFYFYKSLIKNKINYFQLSSLRIKKVLSKSHHVFFATLDNQKMFLKKHEMNKYSLLSESASKLPNKELKFKKREEDKLKCLAVGTLDDRKNILFFIDLFRELDDSKFELNIVGHGPLRPVLNRLISKYNIQNVILHGKVSYDQVDDFYVNNEMLLLPSHAEGNPNVVWEAMRNYTPVMSFKMNGMQTSLEDRGVLINSLSYKENLKNWKSKLIEIQETPSIIHDFQTKIFKSIINDTWESRGNEIIKLYNE